MSDNETFGFQSEREARFPPLVQIALMHFICNSKCELCPVGLANRGEYHPPEDSDEMARGKKAFFSFDIFSKVAREMGRHPWSILRFHGRGEPLMHPHYVDMIRLAKASGIGTVTSFTNATLLDPAMAAEILAAGLDVIELSLDAASHQLYKELRGTEYFEKAVTNARVFITLRNAGSFRTRVIVSAVDSPKFQCEKDAFRKMWHARADAVIFRPYHTYGGRLQPIAACSPAADDIVPCAQLWTRFSINPFGQVNACFNDWSDKEIVGDLCDPDRTIASIWRSEPFEEVRRASLAGRGTLSCCKNCLATRAGWTQSYEKLLVKIGAWDQQTLSERRIK